MADPTPADTQRVTVREVIDRGKVHIIRIQPTVEFWVPAPAIVTVTRDKLLELYGDDE